MFISEKHFVEEFNRVVQQYLLNISLDVKNIESNPLLKTDITEEFESLSKLEFIVNDMALRYPGENIFKSQVMINDVKNSVEYCQILEDPLVVIIYYFIEFF